MHRRLPKRSNAATVYLVLNDFRTGLAYVETAASEADRETIIQNFLSGRYSDALSVVAFNAAEGWSGTCPRTSPWTYCSELWTTTLSVKPRCGSLIGMLSIWQIRHQERR
jgi:hypothetical protein